jgi:alpha-tubulin suppressor-like RCC1 family protein
MRLALASSLALLAVSACLKKDPLYCDENTPCTDPALPFCDHEGAYPASDGIKHTCIPDPFPDGGVDGDDASSDPRIVQLATAANYGMSCAVLSDGGLRCWGNVHMGGELIGDNEHPREAGDISTGGTIAEVAIGGGSACVRYDGGNVRCWGYNSSGQLGYGNMDAVMTAPESLPDVSLGGPATRIVAGELHYCAVLESGEVRCWGANLSGQLGYGHVEPIGDNELPTDEEDPVDVDGAVRDIVLGKNNSCAVLESGQLRCWGDNTCGKLGYGNTEDLGDDEPLSGFVNVGADVRSVALGYDHTCALLESGAVKCWGCASQLGYPGNSDNIGDTEAPASIGNIDLGRPATQIVAGEFGTCALLDNLDVICWGADDNGVGFLGYPNETAVGDDETPAEQGPVVLGEDVELLSVGIGWRHHSCALLVSGAVRCWGNNDYAQLGLLHMEIIGDNENPSSEDPVQILD